MVAVAVADVVLMVVAFVAGSNYYLVHLQCSQWYLLTEVIVLAYMH